MTVYMLFDPFISFGYMRRALIACCALSISITPIGVCLMLKRMSLIGDALSHSILPGVAIGYFYSGLSFFSMSIGGFISGIVVAIFSFWVSENTALKKDASLSGFYLSALAFGVILMSLKGSNIDLLNLLFGSILSVNVVNIRYIGIVSTITLVSLAFFYRILVIIIFDPDFLKENNFVLLRYIQIYFLVIVMLNLIASLQITGTLMSVGLMMLPSLSAGFWVKSLINMIFLSVFIAILCSWLGLLGAFYMSLPAGSAIVLCSSILFIISILFGNNQGILYSFYRKIKN